MYPGYGGGTKKSPKYSGMKDYTECVRIEYDPEEVSFKALVERFFAAHDPHYPGYGRQYRNVLLVADENELSEAQAVADHIEVSKSRAVRTAIEIASVFYVAEDYHVHFYLRNSRVIKTGVLEEMAIHPNSDDFTASRAVTLLNAWTHNQARGAFAREWHSLSAQFFPKSASAVLAGLGPVFAEIAAEVAPSKEDDVVLEGDGTCALPAAIVEN